MEAKFERELASKTTRLIREVRTKETAQNSRNQSIPYDSEATRNCEANRRHWTIEKKDRQRMQQEIFTHTRETVIERMESRSLRYEILSGGTACIRAGVTKDKASCAFEIVLTNTSDIKLFEAGPHIIVGKIFCWLRPHDDTVLVPLERSRSSRFLLDFHDVSCYTVRSISKGAYRELLYKAEIARAKEARKSEHKRRNN